MNDMVMGIWWLTVGILVWSILMYIISHYKYGIKKKVDAYFDNLKKIKKEQKDMIKKLKELEVLKVTLTKDLEQTKREINEKNKYLAEDKVMIERLSKVKLLSDKIASILQEYDKETIKELLAAYSDDTDTTVEFKKNEKFWKNWNKDNKSRKIWW